MRPRPRLPLLPASRPAAVGALVLALGACAELLGIERWQERQPAAGGTGGSGGGGAAGSGGSGGLGPYGWSELFGSAADDWVSGLGVDVSGNVLVTGGFEGDVAFGAVVLSTDGAGGSAGGSAGGAGGGQVIASAPDAFVAKLDAQGEVIWARPLSGPGRQDSRALAVDSDGSAVVAGHFERSLTVGSTTRPASGAQDAFVVKLEPVEGNLVWAGTWGGPTSAPSTYRAADVAVGPEGEVVFGGWYLGIAGGDLGFLGTSDADAFVVKLDAGGTVTGSYVFADPYGGTESVSAVAVADGGVTFACGTFDERLDLGGLGTLETNGLKDAFVVALDEQGNVLWGTSFGGSGNDEPIALALDGAGAVLVGGYFTGTVDVGGTPLESEGAEDAFLVALDDSDGGVLWASSYGGAIAGQTVDGIALDPTAGGSIVTVGRTRGSCTLGTTLLDCGGLPAIVLARFSAAGDAAAARCFGEQGLFYANSVAVAPDRDLVLGGSLTGTVDFGSGPITGAGGTEDAFVAKVAP